MDRYMKWSCFYIGIFCTLFFTTYTISVYNASPLIASWIHLTKELIEKLPAMDPLFSLTTPLKNKCWNHPHGCLGKYLEIFQSGVVNISMDIPNIENNNDIFIIIKRITNCTHLIKDHCKKIREKNHDITKCENKTKTVKLFMEYMLDFSKFLLRENTCGHKVHYKNDWNDFHHSC
ncbi:uncharacterized protein ACNLHF_015461 [Anomaloglossus baeobatrachus]